MLAVIAFRFCGVCFKVKGQIKPKADWRTVDSPKKWTIEQMNLFCCIFCFLQQYIFYIELCTKHLWRLLTPFIEKAIFGWLNSIVIFNIMSAFKQLISLFHIKNNSRIDNWRLHNSILKFIYSERASKFCKTSTIVLSYIVTAKCTVEILQNCVVFSEYRYVKIERTLVQLSFWLENVLILLQFWKQRWGFLIFSKKIISILLHLFWNSKPYTQYVVILTYWRWLKERGELNAHA